MRRMVAVCAARGGVTVLLGVSSPVFDEGAYLLQGALPRNMIKERGRETGLSCSVVLLGYEAFLS